MYIPLLCVELYRELMELQINDSVKLDVEETGWYWMQVSHLSTSFSDIPCFNQFRWSREKLVLSRLGSVIFFFFFYPEI